MDKQRFVLAIVLSAAILFGWSWLFPVKRPQQNNADNANTINANSNAPVNQAASPSPSPQASETTPEQSPKQDEKPACTLGQETVTVTTPLYRVKLDKCGAVVTSWILDKIKGDTYDRKLRSISGGDLELIWQGKEAGKRELFEVPLHLETGDEATDRLLATSTYQTNLAEQEIILESGEKTIEFILPQDESSKLSVTKKITFRADQYSADIRVLFNRKDKSNEDQPKTVKLLIGPNIGDQGIPQYNFYSVAPEGVAVVGDKVERYYSSALADSQQAPRKHLVNGTIDWSAVGDTYFAMAVIPAQKTERLEFSTKGYKHPILGDAQGKEEDRYLITGHVPIPVGDVPTTLYVGPKDHYILSDASDYISGASKGVGRPVDLEGLIDYGFLSWMSRPLAVPILWCIKFLYKITGSYGVAIILFTIVIYSLFFPLKWRSSKAMKRAQKLAPRMKELQEKIKGMKKTDPRLRELQMEQMRLMKEGNPLGGCLPLLIQMPFLFALYRAITISIDFRQARFLWIPDLSAAEPSAIHILPILMAGSMMVLQLITPAPSADPMQRKLMAIGMPLLMLWMLWSAPAGLLVYWLVGNLVGFGQQFIINRLTKTEDDEQPPSGKKADTRSTKKLKTSISQA
ncbi:MAG TPA: membrane protein insertase YidC [Pyrinomonadaceae bacterium]